MANTEGEYNHRRVYARGYFDGMKAGMKSTGEQDGEVMNFKRMTAIKNGLSSIAAKVYDSVPISETWSKAQIQADMARKGIGGGADSKLVAGCLQSLVSDGLVQEPERGMFRRVPERSTDNNQQAKVMEFADTTKKPKPEIKEMPVHTLSVATSGRTAIEKLSALAARAVDLSSKVVALSEDIEAAAVEIEDMMKQHAEDSAKLKQLQALLKGLG